MHVRKVVFCNEQHCSWEDELDSDDARSWHWIVYDPSAAPVAVVRLVPPPHDAHPNGYYDPEEKPYIKLGRFATLAPYRGKGLGRLLVDQAMRWAAAHVEEIGHGWGGNVLVHAQVSVENVWGKMGFVTDEKLGRWIEEGIEHLGMWRRVEGQKDVGKG